jgi:hypothetical protein
MATVTDAVQHRTEGQGIPIETTGKTFKPVKVWAVIGGFFLALQAYIYAAWIFSDQFTRTPKGPDPIPTYMKIFDHTWEALGIPAVLIFLYYFLVRPWRREGRLTLDGMFCFAFLSIYWQDPISNWLAPHFTYTTEFLNFGSWTSKVPGWVSPKAHLLPEPMILMVPMYVYIVFGMAIVGCGVMRWAKKRWPQMTSVGLVGVAAAFFIVFDAVFEPLVMAGGGFWAYPGAIDRLTLYRGHYFQFPIYEPILIGGVAWTAWCCLRFFRNDKGQTVAERGIDEVRATQKQKAWLRTLALIGATNVIYLFGYNIPIQYFNAHGGPWPKDIQNRSYLVDGMCGPGTTYACWSPQVPIPRPHSAHEAPDGTLVPGQD